MYSSHICVWDKFYLDETIVAHQNCRLSKSVSTIYYLMMINQNRYVKSLKVFRETYETVCIFTCKVSIFLNRFNPDKGTLHKINNLRGGDKIVPNFIIPGRKIN